MALSKIDVSKMITGVTPLANGGTGGTSIPATNLASGVTGTLPVASGGTGLTSGTTDQFLKFTGSTTLASAADNAGKILKVQSYEFTGDTHTTSASIQNFLTCSYTPTASNSNLFATLSFNYQLYGNNASLTSGGQVVIETPGSVIRATQGFSINSMPANDHYIEFSGNVSAFWNQNTTSAFNITLGCATRGVGRIRIFGNSAGSPFNPSATRLTVMEIAA